MGNATCDRCGRGDCCEANPLADKAGMPCVPDAAFCFARDKIAETLAIMFWGTPEPPLMRPNLSEPQIDAIARHVREYGNGIHTERTKTFFAKSFAVLTTAQAVVDEFNGGGSDLVGKLDNLEAVLGKVKAGE